MSIESMSVIEQTTVMRDGLAPGKIRALIAKHLSVEIERVTDEAHFANDLGADWLDRVELVIAIEDQFAGVEITDDDVDQMNVVADLIRCIERPDSERAGAPGRPLSKCSAGPQVLRAAAPNRVELAGEQERRGQVVGAGSESAR